MGGPAARLRLLEIGQLDDAQLAPFIDWLGLEEEARMQRFVRAQRRRQFIAGRALARLMLGELLGLAPHQVVIDERPGQKPAIRGAHFSISHSGNWVGCMVSRTTPIGFDIEWMDPARDVMALAGQTFDADQVMALADLDEGARHAVFYRMWTLHEAGIKLGQPSAATFAGQNGDLALAWCSAAPLHAIPLEILASLG